MVITKLTGAHEALSIFGAKAETLHALANFLLERDY
jgi:hypothetical protein